MEDAPAIPEPPPKSTSNVARDNGGPVVQSGVVEGGIHFHQPAARAAPGVGMPHRLGRVPLRADRFQRRAESAELADALAAGGVAVLTSHGSAVRTSVLSGLGGVGKTQLAADHAENAWASGALDVLVWITASTRTGITAAYAAGAATLLGGQDADPGSAARRFLDWLATTDARWLVVLDDLSSPDDILGLWPPETAHGQVIVTTRRRDAALRGQSRHVIDVGLFTHDESVTYVKAKLTDQPWLADGTDDLVVALGHLPLALSQAVAYMIDRSLSCAEYLVRFLDRQRALCTLVPDKSALPDEHRETIAATWSLSVELANALEPVGLAEPVLRVAALLDPNGIPADLLASRAVLEHLSEVAGRPVNTELAHDALTCLHRLNLVTFDRHTPLVSTRMHALVQRATSDQFDDDLWHSLCGVVAAALTQTWPRVEGTPLAQALRMNTEAFKRAAAGRLWRTGRHPVLFRMGTSLGESGHVSSAYEHFDRLCVEAREHLGATHPDTLHARQQAAYWCNMAGFPDEARARLRTLLKRQLGILGPDDRATLTTRRHLLEIDCRHGGGRSLPTAELRELVADCSIALGPDDPLTLGVLGSYLRSQDATEDPAKTKRAYDRAIARQEEVLGKDHRDTLATRRSRALWRAEAGDRAQAAIELEQVLVDQVDGLGRDHPDVLSTRDALTRLRGVVGYARGDDVRWKFVSNAGQVVQNAFRDFTPTRTPADVADSLASLVEDRTRLLGPFHPDTVEAVARLEEWRRELSGTLRRIEELKQELKKQLSHYTLESVAVRKIRRELIDKTATTGNRAEATAMLEEFLERTIAQFGPTDREAHWAYVELVWRRAGTGDRAGAVAALEELSRLRKPPLVTAEQVAADLRFWRGEAGDEVAADILELREILAEDLATLGRTHRYTMTTRSMLASGLGAAGRRAEAVEMLTELLADQVRMLGEHHHDAVITRADLAWWSGRR